MLVDRLTLVVVLGMRASIGACQGLRGLVGFEAEISLLILG
jgi:hypothetical protein